MSRGSNEKPGCLTVILRFIGLVPMKEELPYRLRDDFLSNAERSFYQVLENVVGDSATVCPKVSLADVLYSPRNTKHYQAYYNKISQKHVDFLLCNPDTMQPIFGIELDDSSHNRKSAAESDRFKNAAFAAAGLPLVRVKAQRTYNAGSIVAQITPYFNKVETTRTLVGFNGRCPKCGSEMVLRVARKGKYAGQEFYGCVNYPQCRGITLPEKNVHGLS